MLVCVILGKMCVGMVVHAGILDGEGNHAKREDRAEGGNAEHGESMIPPHRILTSSSRHRRAYGARGRHRYTPPASWHALRRLSGAAELHGPARAGGPSVPKRSGWNIRMAFDRAKVPPSLLETTGLRIVQIACYSACGGACCWSSCRSRCRRLRDRSRAVSLPSWASPKGGSATSCRVPVVLSGLLWYCGCCSSACIGCLSICPLLPPPCAVPLNGRPSAPPSGLAEYLVQ